MSDWTGGYVADIDYTFGYYPEMSPVRMRPFFLNAGIAMPEIKTACELGFGQGISTNIHASTSDVKWYGTDFNPSQAGMADEMAKASGSNAKLYDDAFLEFCNRKDLPNFDFIALHGIWSWISEENRGVIQDFIQRKLNVGGILYISYNILSGWAPMLPMRELMRLHSERTSAPGQALGAKIDSAIEFATQLLATNPLFAKGNPTVQARLDKMRDMNRNYVAHEYFNRDWTPMSFARVSEYMAPAKLSFACRATYIDTVTATGLPAEQQEMLNSTTDLLLKQTLEDMLIAQQFRKDYWIKGARKLGKVEQREQMNSQRYILNRPKDEIEFKIASSAGEINLHAEIYQPLLAVFAELSAPNLQELEAKFPNLQTKQLHQALLLLTSTDAIRPIQSPEEIDAAMEKTRKLNRKIAEKSRNGHDILHFASPVTGCGVRLTRFQQLFLLARMNGLSEVEGMARFVHDTIKMEGSKLSLDGQAITDEAAAQRHLEKEATHFVTTRLAWLKALKVAE